MGNRLLLLELLLYLSLKGDDLLLQFSYLLAYLESAALQLLLLSLDAADILSQLGNIQVQSLEALPKPCQFLLGLLQSQSLSLNLILSLLDHPLSLPDAHLALANLAIQLAVLSLNEP